MKYKYDNNNNNNERSKYFALAVGGGYHYRYLTHDTAGAGSDTDDKFFACHLADSEMLLCKCRWLRVRSAQKPSSRQRRNGEMGFFLIIGIALKGLNATVKVRVMNYLLWYIFIYTCLYVCSYGLMLFSLLLLVLLFCICCRVFCRLVLLCQFFAEHVERKSIEHFGAYFR